MNKELLQKHFIRFIVAGSSYLAIPLTVLAQWSTPVNISPKAISAGLNESMGSCIGTSGDTVHVVWTDKHSSTKAVLYYTHSPDSGLTWSAPVAITDTNGNAWNPAIAVNGSNVHVVWREISTINGHRASWYKHSLDGGNTWGPNVFLDSTADWPAIAVSGNMVYVANDVVTAASPYNTEIFFLRSSDNGTTWSAPVQLTFAVGRSEDEAIHAEGSHVHMSWNDNRVGAFQILYKESNDYGVTWDSDRVVDPVSDYNTMVWSDGTHVDVIATGAPSGKYQLLIAQSADTGASWGLSTDLSNDTAHTYFLPDMIRDGNNLHVVCNSSGGAKYFHSGDGGAMWDTAVSLPGVTFIACTGYVLHVIYVNAGQIYYLRNPTGNGVLLNLTMFLQGYYTGANTMINTLYNLGFSLDSTATDTIQVNLWSAGNLGQSNPDFTAKAILHTNGTASVLFPAGVSGNSYYIGVKHRNAVETWSSGVVSFPNVKSYNFSTGVNQAYSDGVNPPMKSMGAGVYAIYSGDVNQDGAFDLIDLNRAFNDSRSSNFGYIVSDVNGDSTTDLSDMTIIYNNIRINGFFYARPY